MKTLGKKITKDFFITENSWKDIQKDWARELQAKNSMLENPGVHLLYNALRGKDYRKGFTATSNRKKIVNGQYRDLGLMRAIRSARLESTKEAMMFMFGDNISREGLENLISMLPPEEELFPGMGKKTDQYRYDLFTLDPYRSTDNPKGYNMEVLNSECFRAELSGKLEKLEKMAAELTP